MNDFKNQENQLKDRIGQHGLVIDIEHDVFEGPMIIRRTTYKNPYHYIGITTVRLYEQKVWDQRRVDKPKTKEGFVSEGISRCSDLEKHYSPSKGRLIAMGRALKQFEKTLI